MPYSGANYERSISVRQGYFKTAWSDIVQSPHWVTRILLLALLGFIPVFGWIVIAGYLWGWARDVAWGVRTPLPERIFENSDGLLYSRGFFAAIIAIVCYAVVSLVQGLGHVISSGSVAGVAFVWGDVHSIYHAFAPLGVVSGALALFSFVVVCALALIIKLFEWTGTMRMSVYGRLSAGFQVSRLWAMIRHDYKGILRILGMFVVISAVSVAILCLAVGLALLAAGLFAMLFATTGVHMSNASFLLVIAAVMLVLLTVIAIAVLASFLGVLGFALVTRAIGYWTSQFDVANWKGQDDPMPFELTGTR